MSRSAVYLLSIGFAALSVGVACTGEDAPLSTPVNPDGGTEASSGSIDGGASGDAAADAPPARISVTGTLISNQYSIPDDGLFAPLTGPGVSVYIGGKKAGALGPAGSFSVDDVAVPYDAFVIETSASLGTSVWGYLGLTRSDPTLFGGTGGIAPSSAEVSGTLSPGPGVNQVALVAVGGAGTAGFSVGTATSAYAQASFRWASEVAPPVKAAAYTVTSVNNVLGAFLTYGVTPPFVPVAGGPTLVKDITMSPIFSSPAHVSVVVPPGQVITSRQSSYRVAQGPTFVVDATDPASTTLDFEVPSNAVGEVRVTSVPDPPTGGLTERVDQILRPVVVGSQSMTVPSLESRLTAPAANDTVGSGSSVAWTATAGAAYRFKMYSSVTGADAVVVWLNTASTSASLPNLASLGVTLSAGTYKTTLTALRPFASLDAVCGPTSTSEFESRTLAPGASVVAK